MRSPFIVLGLPRSRTWWLSQWLSYGGKLAVEHDTGVWVDSCAAFVDNLWTKTGTVETGAVVGHRLLRHVFPRAKFVTVRREREFVLRSLAALGVTNQEEEMRRRDELLDEAEGLGAVRVEYGDLSDVHCCSWLWEHLLELPFDFNWWQLMDGQNLQVSMEDRLEALRVRRPQIDQLLAEVIQLSEGLETLQMVRIAEETWESSWDEAEAMGRVHHMEVHGGVERSGHPYRVNVPGLSQLNKIGFLRIMTARVNSKLAGYCTWTVIPDMESVGVVVAEQGAFYVSPEFKDLKLGTQLLRRSLEMLRGLGVHSVEFHAHAEGRGAKLGRLLERMGAKPYKQVWAMELDRDQAPTCKPGLLT